MKIMAEYGNEFLLSITAAAHRTGWLAHLIGQVVIARDWEKLL